MDRPAPNCGTPTGIRVKWIFLGITVGGSLFLSSFILHAIANSICFSGRGRFVDQQDGRYVYVVGMGPLASRQVSPLTPTQVVEYQQSQRFRRAGSVTGVAGFAILFPSWLCMILYLNLRKRQRRADIGTSGH